jgi:hypothetical protein
MRHRVLLPQKYVMQFQVSFACRKCVNLENRKLLMVRRYDSDSGNFGTTHVCARIHSHVPFLAFAATTPMHPCMRNRLN